MMQTEQKADNNWTQQSSYTQESIGGWTNVPLVRSPKPSGWKCYLFGAHQGNGLTWDPDEKSLPNSWVRFWMRVFLGCKWVKK